MKPDPKQTGVAGGDTMTKTRYFEVVNWHSFQHYRDRQPLWIKVYNQLLEKYEFLKLPDAAKWHLVAIWLLASRSNNRLPWDETYIQSKGGCTSKVNLQLLADTGFINLLAGCYQDATLETETETETEPPLPPKGGEVALPSALDTPAFRTEWERWEQHRKETRHPIKPTTRDAQLAKLAKWGEARAIAAIRHSIENGYQGLFEPGSTAKDPRKNASEPNTAERWLESERKADPAKVEAWFQEWPDRHAGTRTGGKFAAWAFKTYGQETRNA